jgi:hypothetical protein
MSSLRQFDCLTTNSGYNFNGRQRPGLNEMNEKPAEQLKRLADSDDPASWARYQAICAQRDQVLTRAVIATACYVLEQSGFQDEPTRTPQENNRDALNHLQSTTVCTSIPARDLALLALAGCGTLAGWMLDEKLDAIEFVQMETETLDPVIIHRLARALDRCSEQEPLLQRFTSEITDIPDTEAPLVAGSIRLLLDEIPVNTFEDALDRMIKASIPDDSLLL